MEQKKISQDQLSHKAVSKQPVKQELEAHREDTCQGHKSPDQLSSEEDSEGGTETPSQDSEDESEDSHHQLGSVLHEKAPDNRYTNAKEQKQHTSRQDPGNAQDIIMRYLEDTKGKQSLPYGPDH